MLPSSPMLSAHDAADSRLHHGNDCGDVAAVLLSLCSRRERSDNPEIRLRRSIVSACGSGETIDNPEIRLRRSNVSACGSGETIDNSEQQCSVCSRFLSKCMFSKRQLAKISVIARKCSFCLQEIARNGSKAVIFLESTR